MKQPPTPKCIVCGRRKSVQRIADTFKCTACGAMFDGDPDEGGDYHSDPARRLERREERRQRKHGSHRQ